jgi:hypothetical protein
MSLLLLQRNKSAAHSPTMGVLQPSNHDAAVLAESARKRHEQADIFDQMNKVCVRLQSERCAPCQPKHGCSQSRWMSQMELWAKSVERRSLELTRTNRQLRATMEKSKRVTSPISRQLKP